MALLPPQFLDAVVAIGNAAATGTRGWIASGFLYGYRGLRPDKGKPTYYVYLVTNRHVLDGLKKIRLRCNPQGAAPAATYDADLVDANGAPTWYAPAKGDVAVLPVRIGLLQEHGMQVYYYRNDADAADREKMKTMGVSEGDFAYVLGFPLGMVGDQRSAVIVRSGPIARVRDSLEGLCDTFLVDAFAFPGNSGGPVVLKPELVSVGSTPPQKQAQLLGVSGESIYYRDVAVSRQTKRERVVFEDNAGLTTAYPVDLVNEAVLKHLSSVPGSLGDPAH